MHSEPLEEGSFSDMPSDNYWEAGEGKDLKMHSIHYYPAKFPSFIVSQSLRYAKEKNIQVSRVADIFCGCGTTALEAKRSGIDFWGCDINPVATLIARVKSQSYKEAKLTKYRDLIVSKYANEKGGLPRYYSQHPRIAYWFHRGQIEKLYWLRSAINESVPRGKYRDFFRCAFSNILKPSSRWLTKSIKPQVDPEKKVQDVFGLYLKQVAMMMRANQELVERKLGSSEVKIVQEDYLNKRISKPFVDMVITSPPYVTSYEYADLHQLSSIWLGFARDYRSLRRGTIGSLYNHTLTEKEVKDLNAYAQSVYSTLSAMDHGKAKSIARYFHDMKKTVKQTHKLLRPGGLLVFVIGNTEYSGVEVNNAKYLYDCIIAQGFKDIKISKRIIRGKSLSPYRDSIGRFSSNPNDRKIYRYEFVISAKKET